MKCSGLSPENGGDAPAGRKLPSSMQYSKMNSDMEQNQYYSWLYEQESNIDKMLSVPTPADKHFYLTGIKKLSDLLGSIDGLTPLSINKIEDLTFQCAIYLWQNNEFAFAKNLATDIVSVIGESMKIGILLRKLILDCKEPGSKGKKENGAPLVSIVTPLYNQGKYLLETVQSVLNQNYANWEMAIVNDGSTDNSLSIAREIIEKFKDSRIKLLSHENRGKGYTRNRGVRETSGKYICILDSDDQLAPDYIATATNLLESNGGLGWITPRTLVYGGGHRIVWADITENTPCVRRCISPCSAVYRRSVWEELGGYCENMTDREDWEFWIRAWEAGWSSSNSTDEVLFLYRHAFQRFGTQPEPNVNSKLEIIRMHPWWYKQLNQTKLIAECLCYRIGEFTDKLINMDYLNIATQLHGRNENFNNYMSWLKNNWRKLESSDSDTNNIRLALHYLGKRDLLKSGRYLNQLGNYENDSWQRKLLDCIQPLIGAFQF